MDGLTTYRNTVTDGMNDQLSQDTVFFVGSQDSITPTDSATTGIDSALLIPTDPNFRFWQVKPSERIYFGDARFQPDSSYVEHILWRGLPMSPRANSYIHGDWLTGVLFFSMLILVSVRAGYSKYITGLYQSLVNYPTSFRMFREKNYTAFHGAIRLEILFYIVFSVFIFQVIMLASSGAGMFTFLFFTETFVAVTFYFLAKKLAYLALGSIFIDTSDTKEFLFNMDNFNRGAGIILFPIVALITYFPFENPLIPVIMGVITLLIFYFLFLKRGISILLKKQFPLFYLFLYLCTLEILPLLLIYKMVVD